MFRFKQLLEERADDIVALLTDEHGKVLDDAMGEFIIVYKETGSITAALAAAYGVVKNARRKGSGKK